MISITCPLIKKHDHDGALYLVNRDSVKPSCTCFIAGQGAYKWNFTHPVNL